MMARMIGATGGTATILAIALSLTLASHAGAADPFSAIVTLDRSESLSDASTLNRIQSDALAQVLRRLSATRDHGLLPAANGPNVAGYVRETVTMADGRVRVTLVDESIRHLFDQLRIDAVTEPAPPLVVVPIYSLSEAQSVLWSGPNPWLDAWRSHNQVAGLTTLRLPFGEFGDLQAITPAEALAGDASALMALADRYAVAGAVVADYRLNGEQSEIRLHIVGSDDWRASISLPVATFDVSAVAEAVDRLWVERNIRPTFDGPVSVIDVTAGFATLADWIAIRHALEQSSVVARFDVPVVAGHSARLVVHHHSDRQALAAELAAVGLELAQDHNAVPNGLTLRLIGGSVLSSHPAALHNAPMQSPIGAQPQPGHLADGGSPPSQMPVLNAAPNRIPALRFTP